MAVNAEKVNAAKVLFEHQSTMENLADYFSKLREAEEDGEIGDDTFLNGCSDVEEALWLFAKAMPNSCIVRP